ncbi:MAG: sugar isomerase domain-containing protein [Actinobacteria bacterium]|uniref:Unannotated protein n=1 Tax=freshwater metagenome TaxID=449393 RepID=A0A6J7VYQ9_9ZZZZ|nr:sugar isomerase domain-containing protein [Actinomycetota bacterium]MSX71432.1 sugar isomerase domain-containing protein [Actinomycetota bacterium]MSY69316.1 sugar isomerase domain-containing protein [Actinomycetota bacterium]MTA75319.1 sugar isomerase domain-containing protein [Actinomycetota bacterium]
MKSQVGSGSIAGPVTGTWTSLAQNLLTDLITEQGAAITKAALWAGESIAADGVVHLFGTGHSRIPLEEMFPRYGSFAGFNPMAELSMTFHTQVVGSNGQRQAMFIERVEGFAEQILSNWVFKPQDLLMIFSVGGQTAVPIEMAMGAKARGIKVIVITSVAQNKTGKPTHSSGTTLIDHADLVIDLMVPVGDALVSIPGLATPVGPGSTITAIAVVNEIKVLVANYLVERGIVPQVLTSSAVVGKEESKRLFDAAYAEHARRISTRLTGANHHPGGGSKG